MTWPESPLALVAPWIMKKHQKAPRFFPKNQHFRNCPEFKKIKIFDFLKFQNFRIFDFFLDDEKIFFTRNFFSIWIGRSAHVRVGRWRVGFLSVTAFESQKYRKRFKIPQNHKTKNFTQTKKYTSKSEELIPGRESGFAATAPLEIAARPTPDRIVSQCLSS